MFLAAVEKCVNKEMELPTISAASKPTEWWAPKHDRLVLDFVFQYGYSTAAGLFCPSQGGEELKSQLEGQLTGSRKRVAADAYKKRFRQLTKKLQLVVISGSGHQV